MTTDKDLILYLPFDDPEGYGKAYDYSKSRIDGILSGGAFLTKDAKVGKALDLNGTGLCDVAKDIPLGSDFTLCFFYKPVVDQIGWLLNFSGINNYLDKWVSVIPGQWIFFAFVKSGSTFTAYMDGVEAHQVTLPGTILGFSFNDTNIGTCAGSFDEVMLFGAAKTQTDLLKLQSTSSDVEYYLDGTNFKQLGVYVSTSKGLFGLLERKEGLTVDYDNYHGIVVDKSKPRFKERTITLDCFIEASGKTAFVQWCQIFMQQFQKSGNQRLRIDYDGISKPLVYEVYCPNASDVEKSWSFDNDLMVGTFQLKLVECEPVKRVLRFVGSGTASITVTSSKLLNIYWGDGTHTYDVSGTNKTVTHNYSTPGEYDIVISGVIEDITAFDTNCIVVWDKLQ